MRIIRFLLTLLVLAIPAAAFAQIGIAVSIGPPELPVYEQPMCPGDGYLWTPGYWAYDESISDYYWVPGTWVEAPEVGFLWTPGYWGWRDRGYFFYEGYWGPEIGFYGGINYGYGYFGEGYRGGRWDHDHFFYNRTVNHLDITINRNVYNEDVDRGRNDRRVSYHGGTGGLDARPTPREEAASHQRHISPVAVQIDHAKAARANPEQRAAVNHGKPAVAATARPGDFSEQHGAVRAKEAIEPTKAAEPARTEAPAKVAEPAKHETGGAPTEPRVVAHPKELPPIARPEPVNSGNAKADKQYQQRQEALIAKQTAEREKLQQKQDAEHQRKANANVQQLEQKHQQQTQKLVQKHTVQQQTLQTRQPQPRPAKPEPRK